MDERLEPSGQQNPQTLSYSPENKSQSPPASILLRAAGQLPVSRNTGNLSIGTNFTGLCVYRD